ncbi:MAG: hypothetical protein FD145_748 [Candidatus Saganbacteria bacterium]|uniref:Uncharacterized protein n=1 Tax=Candidatus Saganbacteria bacterium TaxID=2575572 RepID=A0A833L1F4_UNCSA|nr:MAG: hypothetical protein FD145_748 [Candidatus Saganbacteria bacterium]
MTTPIDNKHINKSQKAVSPYDIRQSNYEKRILKQLSSFPESRNQQVKPYLLLLAKILAYANHTKPPYPMVDMLDRYEISGVFSLVPYFVKHGIMPSNLVKIEILNMDHEAHSIGITFRLKASDNRNLITTLLKLPIKGSSLADPPVFNFGFGGPDNYKPGDSFKKIEDQIKMLCKDAGKLEKAINRLLKAGTIEQYRNIIILPHGFPRLQHLLP